MKNNNEFIKESSLIRRKKLGQFFTPEIIAKWMAEWAIQKNTETVLDPSLGLGILAREALNKNNKIKLTGVEIDRKILNYLDSDILDLIDIKNIDFFCLDKKLTFDSIIANPPYIRHHDMSISNETILHCENIVGEKLSGLSNIYIYFCIDIINRLNKDGRAALIIPTDWMNSNFGKVFKSYLKKTGFLQSVFYLDSELIVFEDNLSTASILFLENTSKEKASIDFFFIKNIKFFNKKPSDKKYKNYFEHQQYSWDLLEDTKKWDSLFRRRDRKINYKQSKLIGDFFSSKRGIATGANKFFNISGKEKKEYGLSNLSLKYCVGSSRDVNGLIFRKKDLNDKLKENKRLYLFDPPEKLSKSDKKYIKLGEEQAFHLRYLTANKEFWFKQEKRDYSPIWIGVFNRNNIRFIYNETKSVSLTTFHNLYTKLTLSKPEIMALVFILNHEISKDLILDQRRVYGNGLIKFEPKDILDIVIPDLKKIKRSNILALASELKILDKCYRENKKYKTNQEISKILESIIV